MDFKVSNGIESELTIDDLVDLQEGKARAVREILAKFAVNDDGSKIELEEAKRKIGKMKLSEITDISKRFSDAVALATANPTSASN